MEEKIMNTVENNEERTDISCPQCGNKELTALPDGNTYACAKCGAFGFDEHDSRDAEDARKILEDHQKKERPLYRYLIVEYCFKDDSTNGEKHILGSYPTIGMARLNAGIYIKDNAKRMKKRYRFWQVKVQREKVFFDINTRVR